MSKNCMHERRYDTRNQRPSVRQSRPRHRREHRQRREAEADEAPRAFRVRRRRLAREHPADVRERDRDDHHRDVFDRPEAERAALHRFAEVFANRRHVRADDEVEQEAEEHLDVERHHQREAPAIGASAVGRTIADRDQRGADARHERHPTKP